MSYTEYCGVWLSPKCIAKTISITETDQLSSDYLSFVFQMNAISHFQWDVKVPKDQTAEHPAGVRVEKSSIGIERAQEYARTFNLH